MIVLNNVAVGDNYSDALTILSLSTENISLFVFNNAVTLQVLKKNPGGGQDFERLPEINMSPGSAQFPGAVGLRIKNAVPGQVARVICVAPENDPTSPDPGMVGFVPTTLTLSASGAVGQLGVIYRQLTPVAVTNTVVETDLLGGNFTLASGQMTPNGFIRLMLSGDGVYQAGAAQAIPRFRLKIGGTTVLDTNTVAGVMGNTANRTGWNAIITILCLGSLNSQWCSLNFTMGCDLSINGTTAFATGNGRMDASQVHVTAYGGGSSAVPMGGSTPITFTVVNGSAVGTETRLGSGVGELQ